MPTCWPGCGFEVPTGSYLATGCWRCPPRFPQTAAAAEYLGFLEAARPLHAPLPGYGDNMLQPRNLYGGLLRQSIPALHRVVGVTWTRGHARENMSGADFAELSDDALWQILELLMPWQIKAGVPTYSPLKPHADSLVP